MGPLCPRSQPRIRTSRAPDRPPGHGGTFQSALGGLPRGLALLSPAVLPMWPAGGLRHVGGATSRWELGRGELALPCGPECPDLARVRLGDLRQVAHVAKLSPPHLRRRSRHFATIHRPLVTGGCHSLGRTIKQHLTASAAPWTPRTQLCRLSSRIKWCREDAGRTRRNGSAVESRGALVGLPRRAPPV